MGTSRLFYSIKIAKEEQSLTPGSNLSFFFLLVKVNLTSHTATVPIKVKGSVEVPEEKLLKFFQEKMALQ